MPPANRFKIPLIRQAAELLLEYGELLPGGEEKLLKALDMLSAGNSEPIKVQGACTRIRMAGSRLRPDTPEEAREAYLKARAYTVQHQLPQR